MSRKEDVRQLRNKGKSYDEIAAELNLTKSTVSYHANFDKIAKRREKIKYRELPDGVKSILIRCQNCDKPKIKTKRDYEHAQGDFCSQSCSAIWHNKHNQTVIDSKKQKQNQCIDCKKLIRSNQIRCSDCYKKSIKYDDDMTIQDVMYHKHHRSAAFSLVRWRAKNSTKNLPNYKSCMRCGYDKHVEISHIKAISDFDVDTKLSIVNNLDNLLALCPNCHWELDFGDLTIEQINSENRIRTCDVGISQTV